MYDKRLDLYGSIYKNPMDQIGQGLQEDGWTPSISDVLAQAKQQENKKLASNIPSIGANRQTQGQYVQNNPSLGLLGSEGNWVSALTSGLGSFLNTKNQKDAEDKQLIGQIIGSFGKFAAL